MVKERFLNLPDETRCRYTGQLYDLFYDRPDSSIKVSEIVSKLEIARGSFYHYFEDIADVSAYLRQLALKEVHHGFYKQVLDQGGIFQGLEAYLVVCYELSKDSQAYKELAFLLSREHGHPKLNYENVVSEEVDAFRNLCLKDGFVFKKGEFNIFMHVMADWLINLLEKVLDSEWTFDEVILEFKVVQKWLLYGLPPTLKKERSE